MFRVLLISTFFGLLRCSSVDEEKWIDQWLNHFNKNDTRTWQMRYFENNEYFKAGGPIFIQIGGEWEASYIHLTTGHVYDMAVKLNGTMFYTEHRYYGKSHPRPDTSTDNLKWLTVQQALGDLFNFIRYIKKTRPELRDSGVIMSGVSYAGSLATWFRLKYPGMVKGVWASSAPLLAELDFEKSKDIVTETIQRIGGKQCMDKIESAFNGLQKMVKNGNGAKIRKYFNLCTPFNTTNEKEVWFLFVTVSELIDKFVQDSCAVTIKETCKSILNHKPEDDHVAGLGQFIIENTYKVSGSSCVENYKQFLKDHRDSSWENNKFTRQWNYQTCSELGWLNPGNTAENTFGPKYPLSYFVNFCNEIFDDMFTLEGIQNGIKRTNIEYGGLDLNVTRVYSTQGQLDPWRSMGLQKDINNQSPTVIIPYYSHGADMSSLSNTDSSAMKASKCRIFRLVKTWLNIDKPSALNGCPLDQRKKN